MKKLLILFLLLHYSTISIAADLGVIGNSVAASTRNGAWSSGQGYAAIVAQRAGLTEINVAVSGSTTLQMNTQWNSLLSRNPKPNCILYAPGENDIPNTSVSDYKSQVHLQLSNAIASGLTANNITILTPFIYPNSSYLASAPDYLAALREEAAIFNIPLIDIFRLFSEYSLTRSDYSTLLNVDGHPTVAGMIKIADQFKLLENSKSCAYKNPPIQPAASLHSVVLNGSNKTASINSTNPSNSAKLTISMAIKLNLLNSEMGLFGSINRSDYGEGAYLNSNGNVVFCRRYNKTDGCFITSGAIVDTFQWHYVMISGDATQSVYSNKIQIWIDGVQQLLTTVGISPSFTFFMMNNNSGYNINIGRKPLFKGTDYFNGKIADIHFIDGQQQMNQLAFSNNNSTNTYLGNYGLSGSWLSFCNTSNLSADDKNGLCVGNGSNNWNLNNINIFDISNDIPN